MCSIRARSATSAWVGPSAWVGLHSFSLPCPPAEVAGALLKQCSLKEKGIPMIYIRMLQPHGLLFTALLAPLIREHLKSVHSTEPCKTLARPCQNPSKPS